MTKKTRYFLGGSAAILVAGLGTGLVAYYGGGFPSLSASRSGPSELSYVPPESAVVAFANVREVMDSQLRLPPESHLATSCKGDVLVATTSAASSERRKRLEGMGLRIENLENKDGRVSVQAVIDLLSRENYLSLMIEAGSRVNWAALESGIVDKVFFYYAPKILGGLQSLPVVGGAGRKRRKDAIRFRDVRLHSIALDEFAVEAYMVKEL